LRFVVGILAVAAGEEVCVGFDAVIDPASIAVPGFSWTE
jgi:hypothetical protein